MTDKDIWERAKQEVREILVAKAKSNDPISYSDLANSLRTVRFEARDPRLFELLGEISIEENNAGRGMLSAFVIHKNPDYKPRVGFFELAKKLGRDISDEDQFWIKEMEMVRSLLIQQA